MSLEKYKRLLEQPLVVLDIETTGFYFDSGDEIVELAAEKLIDLKPVAFYQALIRPTRSVPAEVVAIHGLDDIYLARYGRPASVVFPEFAEFIGQHTLVGHNIRRFDLPFIINQFNQLSLPALQNEIIDTLELSRQYLNLPNHKLGTVATHLSISNVGAHRAARDVAITRQILLKFFQGDQN